MELDKKQSPDPPGDETGIAEKLPTGRNKIVALLVRKGILSETQIEYACRVTAKLESPQPFLDVLKKLKYINDDQITQIIRANYRTIQPEDLLLE